MLEAFRVHIESISKADGTHKFSLDSVLEMGEGHKALELLVRAIQEQKQIIIGGDYDCDGMSGTALALYFFKEVLHYSNINYIIPRRNIDSYGMSVELLQAYAHQERLVKTHYNARGQSLGGKPLDFKDSLFLTIDNGATIPDEVCAFLHAHNTPLILSDHHEFLEGRIPACDAFVHPLLSDKHPFKGISGACVGYLLLLAYAKHTKVKMRLDHLQYLQVLAGLSTIGDMMDLSAPYNRQLVQRMDHTLKSAMPNSLKALYLAQKYQNPYKLSALAWDIIPLINAVGRLDGIEGFCHCNLVVDLLATREANPTYATLLVQTNQKRKECIQEIKKRLQPTQKGALIYAGGQIPRGVLGMLANQFLEMGGRLSLCWRFENTSIEASLRSKEADLMQILSKLKENGIGVQGGGHKQACGLVFETNGDFYHALEILSAYQ
ncbi:Single-stranded-DNA-specific exonuclease RecJ [Helicobacter heilmannii]|uniref:DHH family phosphoesterase n=1 Tax=Helicobacter heilmannii TaxID=35817 RepID=UPI0006A16DB1|nr:DHH family phosphoesterase [Helicobacter heilmannii]CRF48552.1 Single-stranded-DNA-specific exonuclease RecJ [Helicobacter heilmannii]